MLAPFLLLNKSSLTGVELGLESCPVQKLPQLLQRTNSPSAKAPSSSNQKLQGFVHLTRSARGPAT